MKRFFGTDSPSFRFMTILLELAEINLLFLLCSIPIVTIGAAYSAMLHSLYGMHKYGEGCFSVKMFFRVFRRSLKPLIPAWCVIVICYILLGCQINQMIISKNPQFTGISARQQLEFTTHLLLTD